MILVQGLVLVLNAEKTTTTFTLRLRCGTEARPACHAPCRLSHSSLDPQKVQSTNEARITHQHCNHTVNKSKRTQWLLANRHLDSMGFPLLPPHLSSRLSAWTILAMASWLFLCRLVSSATAVICPSFSLSCNAKHKAKFDAIFD